jgi:hypothetical protein
MNVYRIKKYIRCTQVYIILEVYVGAVFVVLGRLLMLTGSLHQLFTSDKLPNLSVAQFPSMIK